MNAIDFCGEYATELQSGKITFSKKIIEKFINQYTYFDSSDFTKQMRLQLVSFVMIPLYNQSISKYSIKNECPDKIELPEIVFS